MEQISCQDRLSYSLYFDLNIWLRARKVTGTFEKRAPGPILNFLCPANGWIFEWLGHEPRKMGASSPEGDGVPN